MHSFQTSFNLISVTFPPLTFPKTLSKISPVSSKLSSTNLSLIPSLSLSHLDTLEELILNENKISSLNSGAFRGLKRLRVIKIQYCQALRIVQSEAFSDNRELTDIDISYNDNLAVIDENTFSNLPRLSDLNLSHNKLSKIPLTRATSISLQSLLLTGNPWTCDCQTRLLVNPNLKSDKNRSSARCSRPYTVKGELLSSVKLAGCTDEEVKHMDNLSTSFLILIGGILTGILMLILLIVMFRGKIKDIRWRKTESAIKNKELEYQKSFIQYDEYFISLARQQAELEQNQNIPVTEL